MWDQSLSLTHARNVRLLQEIRLLITTSRECIAQSQALLAETELLSKSRGVRDASDS